MANGIDNDGRYYVETVIDFAGDTFELRFTLLAGRQPDDTIPCHVDYRRQSDAQSGRLENVDLSPRTGGEDHAAALNRNLATLIQGGGIPSPVFP